MMFAGKHEGLPVGYLVRPIEFADPVTLVDPLLYRTGPHPWGKKQSSAERVLGRRVWFLIALSVGLCVLCNLMGPATAVLVIPSLQWITTERVGERQFTNLNSAQPPKIDPSAWFWYYTGECTAEHFSKQEFTCAYNPFGIYLDQWAGNVVSGLALSSQSGLGFYTNSTGQITGSNAYDARVQDILFWAPSRQIVANLSVDADVVASLSKGVTVDYIATVNKNQGLNADPIHTYTEYNKSRELEITRNGPINGAVVNVSVALQRVRSGNILAVVLS